MEPVVSLDSLISLVNVNDEEILQTLENQDDLWAVCVSDGVRWYSKGEETRATGLKCIDKIRWGVMSHHYVKSVDDVPSEWRLVNESPFNKAIQGYQKECNYELSFGYLPEEINKDMKGNGFSYLYKGDGVSIYLKEGVDVEIWDAIIHIGMRPNSLNLMKFRLAKPWLRRSRRDRDSYSVSHELGWHDSLYGHLG